MFSGIVESLGVVEGIVQEGQNITFTIKSEIAKDTYIDQSIAHNGVCLTVIAKDDTSHQVTAIHETLIKSNLGNINVGDTINLERAITGTTRMDGHVVQGHVDGLGKVLKIEDENGSWRYTIKYDNSQKTLVVPKGSVCLDGISLTVIDPTDDQLEVAIIPYTYENTVVKNWKVGDRINIEFDIFGKYVQRYLEVYTNKKS